MQLSTIFYFLPLPVPVKKPSSWRRKKSLRESRNLQPLVESVRKFIAERKQYQLLVAGNIFLIALIFHVDLSKTTIKLLHIFRIVLSLFLIS